MGLSDVSKDLDDLGSSRLIIHSCGALIDWMISCRGRSSCLFEIRMRTFVRIEDSGLQMESADLDSILKLLKLYTLPYHSLAEMRHAMVLWFMSSLAKNPLPVD